MAQNTHHNTVKQILSSMQTTDFRDGRQHDAIEFIDKLLEQLNMEAVMYSTSPNIIEASLRVQISDAEKGLSCTHCRLETRFLWSLSLPVDPERNVEGINSLIQKSLKKSQTESKSCLVCRMNHCMLHEVTFETLPSFLIIRPARLLSDGRKFEKSVEVPDDLQFSMKNKARKH